jgi:hypothetical protein
MQLHSDKNLQVERTTLSATSVKNAIRSGSSRLQTPVAPLDHLIDSVAGDICLLRRGDYSIRLVDSPVQRSKASSLIERMYSSRGYNTEGTKVISYNPNRLTFVATSDQQLSGTLTLGIDAEEGLFADELYEKELNMFRKNGRKICEVSKLAIEPQCSSKELFASLFHLAYIFAYILHEVNDAFIEVNPRHANFYKHMLGFCQIGEKRRCPRVDAPAVLMHLDLGHMKEQISSYAGIGGLKERSIYPYFLSQHEEKRLTERIRNTLAAQCLQ